MNNEPLSVVNKGESSTARRLRRFPGLSRDDLSLLQGLTPAQARAMERTIRAQNRADARFAAVVARGENALDHLTAMQANFSHGAGGGRKRHAHATDG